jgi:hypothetical protein
MKIVDTPISKRKDREKENKQTHVLEHKGIHQGRKVVNRYKNKSNIFYSQYFLIIRITFKYHLKIVLQIFL